MKKKTALLQFSVAFSDRKQNMQTVETLFQKYITGDIDFVCLPETWDLGFYPKEDLYDLADENGEHTKNFLSELAKSYNVNIVGGSVIERQDDVFFNKSYIYDRKGNNIAEYTKMHGSPTVRPAGNEIFFKSGNEIVTFEFDGIKCGVMICYDTRFPELARSIALQGAQILFVPMQWPIERLMHWEILSHARALENFFYIAGANASGGEGMIVGCGYSCLIDPWGVKVASCGEEDNTVVIGDVDFNLVNKIRSGINVFKDRKPEAYKI